MDYDERYFIEALSRGLRVLEAFSESKSELSLVEIATAVNLDNKKVDLSGILMLIKQLIEKTESMKGPDLSVHMVELSRELKNLSEKISKNKDGSPGKSKKTEIDDDKSLS